MLANRSKTWLEHDHPPTYFHWEWKKISVEKKSSRPIQMTKIPAPSVLFAVIVQNKAAHRISVHVLKMAFPAQKHVVIVKVVVAITLPMSMKV